MTPEKSTGLTGTHLPKQHLWLVLGIIALAQLMVVLDSTIYPPMGHRFAPRRQPRTAQEKSESAFVESGLSQRRLRENRVGPRRASTVGRPVVAQGRLLVIEQPVDRLVHIHSHILRGQPELLSP